MATHDIFMPAFSSTMTEGKIVEWLKKPGDIVERGESVLVVESDKADMDVESFQDGVLASIVMPAGSSAPVGETIGLIVETADEIASVQADSPSAPAQSASQEKESSGPSQLQGQLLELYFASPPIPTQPENQQQFPLQPERIAFLPKPPRCESL